jgi:signal-transduction protein with cAMP-binding, CBS, and nucleotidyltransferase domain
LAGGRGVATSGSRDERVVSIERESKMAAARQFMSSKIESISADESVDAAARRMRDADVGALLVTEPDGMLTGMITDRDIVTGCIAAGHDPAKCPVSSLADHPPVTVDAGAELGEILKTMGRSRVRRVPVTDGGRLVGVIGMSDLLKAATPDEIGSLFGRIVHK